jgi:hypothetical protein
MPTTIAVDHVLVLRCTARLLQRMKTLEPEPPQSTTRLGDCYANLVRIGRRQLVLAVSGKTFLPAVVEAAPASTLVTRLADRFGEVLRELGIAASAVREERDAMNDVVIAKTNSRQVVGVLVELSFLAESWLESEMPLLDISLRLANTPVSPLEPVYFPNDAARQLFGAKAER